MARRRGYSPVYTGSYLHTCNYSRTKHPKRSLRITNSMKKNLWSLYIFFVDYYLVFCTIFFLLVMCFILPDLVHMINKSKEIKSIKKMVNMMSNEVTRAEVACITAADEICCLHCSMQDGATETVNDLRDLSVCTSCCMRSTRSEPVQVEKKIGFFRRIFFPNKNAGHKEIAIMSYVYTNSFDALKPNSTDPEI